mmetsp:Transcript_30682/g.97902  ORF Transcript_30682/g.97902 Transcript_30682/m.97902 type:complete len:221 (+) Transcript_30682:330-992(+)
MRMTLKTLVTLIGTDGAQKTSGALMAFANWWLICTMCRCSSSGASSMRSNLQPTRTGVANLFRSRAFWCQTRIRSSVSGLERSKSSSIAAASLHASGSIDSKSLWPPMSQIENVTSCPRMLTVFSMKLTPCVCSSVSSNVPSMNRFISDVLPTWLSPSRATLMSGRSGGALAAAAGAPLSLFRDCELVGTVRCAGIGRRSAVCARRSKRGGESSQAAKAR